MSQEKRIIVGSQNPNKIEGVKLGFEQMFPTQAFTIVGCDAPSGVADQPFSTTETIKGAFNRASVCLEKHPNADFFCGIESGIEEIFPNELSMMTWAVILDQQGQQGRGHSSGYFLDHQITKLVQQGYEVGDAIDKVFNLSNSKQSGGANGVLTGGAFNRTDMNVEASRNAFIPHKNPQLYFQNS